jgi:hypothetical protein
MTPAGDRRDLSLFAVAEGLDLLVRQVLDPIFHLIEIDVEPPRDAERLALRLLTVDGAHGVGELGEELENPRPVLRRDEEQSGAHGFHSSSSTPMPSR